jgi:hypothetical protein
MSGALCGTSAFLLLCAEYFCSIPAISPAMESLPIVLSSRSVTRPLDRRFPPLTRFDSAVKEVVSGTVLLLVEVSVVQKMIGAEDMVGESSPES